ncbi:M4 family metallopeptidase [Streptomyces sp. NPDC048172]|uniref:M4 family metallopeptidase n=1 Tax=Streptomyces sp. NPDC048172 TaxID=3365505 RepID=UPI003721CF50
MAAWAAAALAVSLLAPQALAGSAGPQDGAAPPPDPVPDRIAGQGTAAPRLVTGLSDAAPGGSAADAARAYLAGERDRFHVAAGEKDLALLGTEGSTVRFQQRHHGIPVLGAHYLVHLKGKGERREVTGAGGAYFTRLDAPAEATVPAARSAAVARTALKDPRQRAAAEVSDHGLVVLPGGEGGKGRLARHHTVRAVAGGEAVVREVYVDATLGAVALQHDSARQAETPAKANGTDVRGKKVTFDAARQDDGTYRMSDLTRGSRIDTYDAGGRDYGEFLGQMPAGMVPVQNKTADYPASAGESGAVNAHVNSARVYDFYKSRLGRDGIDGKGGTLTSVVNVTSGGKPFANAFWDGEKMVYGGGGAYYSFAAALDVTGHEMTHGVIERSANLVYMNQSGAMNEAIADYFGNAMDVEAKGTPMSDPEAGLLAEDLCRTGTPKECALRDLNDGRNAMDDYIGATVGQDSGGVHLNSTIYSGALWDIREQLDPATADKLVYKALTEYMTPLDRFMDGRNAMVAAADAMGLPLEDIQKVTAAFDGHMIHTGWEHHLGIDSKTVLPDITSSFAAPSAREGRYVVSNSDATGTKLPSVFTGATSGGAAKRLSPDDGRWHEFPATDGTYAAWMAIGERDGAQSYDVLTRRLAKGKPKNVFSSTTVQPQDIVVDGRDVAFLGYDLTTGVSDVYLSRGGKPAKKVKLSAGHQAWSVDMRDGTLVWTEYWKAEKGTVFVPTAYDVERGKVLVRYPPKQSDGDKAPLAGYTKTAGDRVLWTERAQATGAKTAIRSGTLRGPGKVKDVVPADAPYAPVSTVFTATDKAVTYLDVKGGQEWANENLSKLFQVPFKGGEKPVRLSCNRGTQTAAAADEGKGVLWIDGTGGQTDLVTRTSPAGSCA